jgi:serine/threonine protein phosphatase PrpC
MNTQNSDEPTKKVRARIPLPGPQISESPAITSPIDPLLKPTKISTFPTGSQTITRKPIPDYEPEPEVILERKRFKLGRKKKKHQKKSVVAPSKPEDPRVEQLKPLPEEAAVAPQMEYTINGNPILGRPTSINAKPWWESGYWKVGEDEGFREMEVDIGTAGTLAVIGATLRGGKHRYSGGPNQDSYAILHDESVQSYLLVAVSDGVSNAQFSGYSSRKLVRHTVRAMARSLSIDAERTWTSKELQEIANTAIINAADSMCVWETDDLDSPKVPSSQATIYDLSATLTVAVIPTNPSPNGSRPAIVGFVGDSPSYILQNNTWRLITPAIKQGDVMDQSTAALPLQDNSKLKVDWIDVELAPGSALFVVTDGIGTSLDNGNTTLGEYLRSEWARPCSMKQFTNALDFDRSGEDDDRTAVAVWIPPFDGGTTETVAE